MTEKRDHLGLREEGIKDSWEDKLSLKGLLSQMSDGEADIEELTASADGQITYARMMLMRYPEDSTEEEEYWIGYGRGLKKTVHGEGLEKWALYVPLAAETNPGRRFPLIFLLHGAHNPIQLTESYGIVQIAARDECIVIAPENENWEKIEALLTWAEGNLPVDLSRVYCMGYSYGGFMSARLVLKHPEIFAGAGFGGMLFAGNCPENTLDGQYYPAYELTQADLDKARELGVALAVQMGDHEMLRLLPLWREPAGEAAEGIIPLFSKDKQKSFDNLRYVSGCGPVKFLTQSDVALNETEAHIGARFERAFVQTWYGRKYFIGESVRPDGECVFRTIAVDGMVHWTCSMFAELVWEHIRRFARDPETGKLKSTGNA